MSNKMQFSLIKHHHIHLLICQLATVLLFVNELSSWMLAIIALSFIWQFSQLLNRGKTGVGTPKLVVILFALAGAGVIVVNSKALGVLLAMIHLITFAYAIKPLEIKTRKDFYIVILIGLFLQACAFIFIQNIWFAVIVIAVVLLNLALLFRVFALKLNIIDSYSQASKLLLFSVPLAIALFIFFPRLSPFWQMPLANTAKTGLGNDVQPGDIAKLALSEELAFRVEFTSLVPNKSQMYWRAMTMPFYDGSKWSRTDGNRPPYYLLQPPQINYLTGELYQYQVMAEASNQPWLFVLDTARLDDQKVRQLSDFSVINDKPITKTMNYQVTSFANSQKDLLLSQRAKRFYSRVPEQANPKLQALGKELSERFAQPQQIIEHVLSQFREQPYFYTLQPPLLANNSLDQFYFDTRTGFCEHYASTFAFLMRAAGIPARLVTGYLGGEFNQQGNYYSIYQYDAHAWTEVWLEGQGWVSVDPTSAVSPERVSDDMSDALRQQRVDIAGIFSWQAFNSNLLIAKIKMQIDAIDYQWNRLVLSYTAEKQARFLKSLFGQGVLWKAVAAIMAIFLMVVALLWFKDFRPKRSFRIEKWLHYFEQLLKALSKQGIHRNPSQLPISLVPMIKAKSDGLAVDFQLLCLAHEELHYRQLSETERKRRIATFIINCKALIRKTKQLS